VSLSAEFSAVHDGHIRLSVLRLLAEAPGYQANDSVLHQAVPYADCIRRYDSRPGTLFYCDPPYWGCTDDYGKDIFSPVDFEALRGLLEGLQGRFILSINDTPEIRSIFHGFDIEEVGLNYRVSGKVTAARELIVSGPS
jgi:Site-specific DNA methylase